MIIGIGTDLVETARIERALERRGERFLKRIFTDAEAAYCHGMKRSADHLAARFAAKEAASKALGTGFSRGVGFRQIEVEHEPSGRPRLRLHGEALRLAEAMGVRRCHVTLTHSRTHAAATVVLEGDGSP